MKRINVIVIAVLLFRVVVGCVDCKVDDNESVADFVAPRQLYASYESVVSRTIVRDDKYVQWSEGDEIAYFPRMNSNVEYRLHSTSTTEEGYCLFQRISNDVKQGNALKYNYAVYPYSGDISLVSEGNVSVKLPQVQSYAENSFGAGAAPMVAISDGEDGILHFENCAGFLKLQLYGRDFRVCRIKLCGNNGEKLAGAATISVNPDSSPKITISNSTVDSVLLDCGEGVQLGESKSQATAFWFALPEIEFAKGFTITIYDADDTPYVKSTSNRYVIERNTIQPMKALDVRSDLNIDISEDNGKVLFYLSERSSGIRKVIGADGHKWADCRVSVNSKVYNVELDDSNQPYIRVEYNSSESYKAVLLVPNSDKWYQTSPYESVVLPCSQFDARAAGTIRSFPMYAVYTKANGRNLVFDYGFSLLHLRLKGEADIISARVESSTRYDLSGSVDVADTYGYKVNKGANFVALNCVNNGAYAALDAAKYRDFYLMIAPGDYSEGLRLSVCDTNFKASFYDLSDVDIKAGDIYTFEAEYKPNEKQIFYEGFDNCVWGGDVVRGREGVGFSPDGSVVRVNSNLDRTGYEEALTMVPYNVVGSGFVQSNTWSNVSTFDVNSSHQTTDSYIESRHFAAAKYLFRVQEHPGYIAAGTGNTARGIYRSPMIRNMKGLGSFKFKMRFAMQAGFNGVLLAQVVNGGHIVSARLDGREVNLDSDNYIYKSVTSTFRIPPSQLSIASSVEHPKAWSVLEIEVANAANGSRIDIRDEKIDSGVHGIYIDSIEAEQIDEWERKSTTLRVLMWNIQNGMWADQHNNYDNFVAWVKKWNPDLCIWCESESIYKDMTNTSSSTKYLPDGWPELCKRYGHSYSAVGGNRDNFPQTITSKYPISVVQRITDTNEKNRPVSHGAGHFTITVNGKKLNVVTLHMWPQSYGYGVATADRETSTANNEGDKYRAFEMQYIVDQTVNNSKYAGEKYWLFGGDTNSRSRLDNWFYGYDTNSTKLITHDIVLNKTSLKDIIGCCYPGSFLSSTYGDSRIDILYASPEVYGMLDNAMTLIDEWLSDGKKSEYTSSFYDRSDHRPLIMDFDLSK